MMIVMMIVVMMMIIVLGFLRSDVVYIAGLKDLLNCKLDYFG